MNQYVHVGSVQVAKQLKEFIDRKALPGTGVDTDQFWAGFESLYTDFAGENQQLLERRETIQKQLNEWHQENQNTGNQETYQSFLEDIGYLEEEPENVTITTENVDDEVALQAGPQLVVPVNNARYAINAANARWGSLYDALYGTDAISEEDGTERAGDYNPKRGEKVIAYAKQFLDDSFALKEGSHQQATGYAIDGGELTVSLSNDQNTSLEDGAQLLGYQGAPAAPTAILLQNNGLHVEVQIDPNHPIGQTDAAHVKDVLMESAVTTIMDCEDSVAAVDAEDKVLVYENWLGLMKGDLSVSFQKGGKTMQRALHPDRRYTGLDGSEWTLPGRSLMFVRNVGHLMTTPAVLTTDGNELPEGILDTIVTSLIAKHDVQKSGGNQNSRKGSVYIVKPKMHGPAEVAFANRLFNRVEEILGLPRHTLKIGVMDEERRTTLNLNACIQEVKDRVAFINTGFLDRTGDEIHTSMEAGAMIRKHEMKASTWLNAYEQSNVVAGLSSGFQGRAQIGKGMWAMPDLMNDMLEQKGGQLKAGANTAWVPSPTAATLHALHYHQNSVPVIQEQLAKETKSYRKEILHVPVAKATDWSSDEVQQELDNNAQGILGYVVRWVEQGVGCSKVPDINNVALMEDRATLRISSQHMSNWLRHGIVTDEQVAETMRRMAKVVDDQNAGDAAYRPMAENYDASVAFQAALELVFKGTEQPSGYTEPILHRRRLEFKQKLGKELVN
ncbi:malate synthase G [Shouchella shacheensis]|uniref:malate synthase G n=1 Tax=Shouchella shacheensis TaxID=1649580 RepID=UPI0007402BD6|nr:malate synthase G [Shouchella shacheensis]